MLILSGVVLGVVDEKTSKGTNVRKIQVLNNGGKYKSILQVVDWDNRSWKEGEEIEIPVILKTNVSKDGKRAFVNYTAVSQEG